jgi:hypothetical protein
MVVTLPFVLLLLDYWPLGRFPGRLSCAVPFPGRHRGGTVSSLVLEKVPLFLLSVASCAVTYLAQAGGGAVGSLDAIPLSSRLSNAAVSYVSYLWKAVWPSGLAVFYPHPTLTGSGIPAWKVTASMMLLCTVTFFSLRWTRAGPYVRAGWFWYIVTLLPVIGLVQIGSQSMADRYTYVPLVGPFIAAAWGVPDLLNRFRPGRLSLGISASVVLCILATATWFQVGHWKNSAALYDHALEVTRDNWMAHHNLANDLLQHGEIEGAYGHYLEAVRIRPFHPYANTSLGWIYSQQGRHENAIAHYRKALQGDRSYAEAHYQLGLVLSQEGDRDGAIRHFSEALRLRPGDRVIRSVLNMALEAKQK